MLSKTGFNGILMNHSAKTGKGEEPSWIQLKIVHTSEGEVQNFIDSLEKAYNVHNFKDLFTTTVQWDKMVFAHLNFDVVVTFDEVEFDATLTGITVVRKVKAGVDSFVYTMIFEKEMSSDNLDKTLMAEYLKRKHQNEEEKMVFTQYNVKVRRAEEEKDEVLN